MKRILFVDDDSKILDGLRRTLHGDRNRWEMEFALGGEAALKACGTGNFDVVVSDMRMPGMDGATLLGHIRDRFPDTARIVLSGYSEVSLSTRASSVAHRFLAKPSNATEIESTIERVCAMQDLLGSPEIRKLVGTVGGLPSLSTTYMSLTRVVKDPNASIGQVAKIVEQDLAMSAKVLQLTNSAFFGLAQRVTSLSSAVSYLGMETIKNLALASEAFRVFVPDPRIPRAVCDAIQQHALLTAAVANVLPVERKDRDFTAVAALLHDIGSLFLASTMPKEFSSVLSLASERGCRRFEVEEELLGASHAEIGAYLLGLWGIPDLAVEAIAHHHHPTRIPHTGFDCTVAVYVANLLAHRLEADPLGTEELEFPESDRACLETLGLLPSMADFRKLAQQSIN
jgi:HD-like signal output (HDOD) protein/ActR/RegA family two-component response regulator